MNATELLIHQRKSIRAYKDTNIPSEIKSQILNAVFRAPTAGNLMLYSIIDVSDPAAKDKLALSCDNQPFIARAPWVLLFCGDYQRWYEFYKKSGIENIKEEEIRRPEEGDLFLACCDALIAAQTSVLAAESFGIGSCYIGDIMENYEIHRDLFKLPAYVFPITLVCYGYPTEQQQTRPKTPRFDKNLILHENTYKPLDRSRFENMAADLRKRFAGHNDLEKNNYNVGQLLYNRKFNSDFVHEMNRSVRCILKNWTKSQTNK